MKKLLSACLVGLLIISGSSMATNWQVQFENKSSQDFNINSGASNSIEGYFNNITVKANQSTTKDFSGSGNAYYNLNVVPALGGAGIGVGMISNDEDRDPTNKYALQLAGETIYNYFNLSGSHGMCVTITIYDADSANGIKCATPSDSNTYKVCGYAIDC